MPLDPAPRRLGVVPLVLFGAWLARRGWMARVAIAITIATGVALGIFGLGFARAEHPSAHDVPLLASSAVAWGGGFLLAFAASLGALVRDRDEGIGHLVRARSRSGAAYVGARVGGLALVLGAAVSLGTFVAGAPLVLAAGRGPALGATLQATVAALVFALAFAIVMAPVALAALGPRSRIGGYGALLAVLFVPELFALALGNVLPDHVCELVAIPSALAAVRSSLAPNVDPLRLARALVALSVFVAIALVALRRSIASLATEPRP